MDYFRINYNRLENLKQINFYKVISAIILSLTILVVLACFIKISNKETFSGIYQEGKLTIKINTKLSDTLKNNKYVFFNDEKVRYKVQSFGEIEIIDNEIYQEATLTIDKKFVNNEVGLVELYYDKQKLIKYIFELFK